MPKHVIGGLEARPLPAVVRAHLVEPGEKNIEAELARRERERRSDPWPPIHVAFHTYANSDEFGVLRYGTYVIEWFNPVLGQVERVETGFFVGETLSEVECAALQDYCGRHDLTFRTRRDWLQEVLFKYGYEAGAAVVGFNLALQLARIATRLGQIKRMKPTPQYPKPNPLNDLYVGGWRFILNEREKKTDPGQWRERGFRPAVLVKPITPRAAMYRWGFFRDWRGKGTGFNAGRFLDLRTLGQALANVRHGTLRELAELLGAEPVASDVPDADATLGDARLDQAIKDIEALHGLYYAEISEFEKHGLHVGPDRIYSGASLGKGYLDGMGIHAPPVFDPRGLPYSADEILGFAMSAFYSGRLEAHILRTPVPVTYVDFHSMYPAVCILQGLWAFMKAEAITATDATNEARTLLADVEPEDLRDPKLWTKLPMLCLVEPLNDVLPVRGDFRWRKPAGTPATHRTCLAEVASSSEPLWWTLADCIASKLHTGKPPQIKRALKFSASGERPLQPISIRGGKAIDPSNEDFFRSLVDARDRLGATDKKLADALKIVVNAAAYGIWVEVDIEDGARAVTAHATQTRKSSIAHGEKPGSYYFPPLAAFVTAAGRLLITLLEHEIGSRGGATTFCATDSLAVVSSQTGGEMSYRDHTGRRSEIHALTWREVDAVLQEFESLNPYSSGKPLIKLESENYIDGDPAKGRCGLHAFVIAPQRYALFNPPDRIIKGSQHTLGLVTPPREGDEMPIEGWIDQIWRNIVSGRRFEPSWASQPVEFRLEVSRPDIRKAFKYVSSLANVQTGNKWMDDYLARVKPHATIAVLAKRQDKLSAQQLESPELDGVPVIAAVGVGADVGERRWVAMNSGRPVVVIPPEGFVPRVPGMSDKEFEDLLLEQHRERQAVLLEIAAHGGLFTTAKTFGDLIGEFVGHHEPNVVDRYGTETSRETRGLVLRPRVRIAGVWFAGKETYLQDDVDHGLASAEEAAASRVLIRPETDPRAELLVQALGFLSKAALKQLGFGWRGAARLQNGDSRPLTRETSRTTALIDDVVRFLKREYPPDVGGLAGEAALQAFVDSRRELKETWKAVRLNLPGMSTDWLAQIAECSTREAIRIKKGEVEPKLAAVRRIVAALGRSI